MPIITRAELAALIKHRVAEIQAQYPVLSDYEAARRVTYTGHRLIVYRDEQDPYLIKEHCPKQSTIDTSEYPKKWCKLSILPPDTRERWERFEGKTIYQIPDFVFDPVLRPFSSRDVLPFYNFPVHASFSLTEIGFDYDFPPLDDAGKPLMSVPRICQTVRKAFPNAVFYERQYKAPFKETYKVVKSVSVGFPTLLRYRIHGTLARAVLSPYEMLAYILHAPTLGYLTLSLLLFQTGARVGELLNLQETFINPNDSTITYKVEKKRGVIGPPAVRTLIIKPVIMDILQIWLKSDERQEALRRAEASGVRVFTGDVFPFPYSTLSDNLLHMASRFGVGVMEEPDPGDYRRGSVAFMPTDRYHPTFRAIRRFGPHVFRASYITNLYLVDKMDPLRISRIVGHADMTTTMRYIARFSAEKAYEVAAAKTFEVV